MQASPATLLTLLILFAVSFTLLACAPAWGAQTVRDAAVGLLGSHGLAVALDDTYLAQETWTDAALGKPCRRYAPHKWLCPYTITNYTRAPLRDGWIFLSRERGTIKVRCRPRCRAFRLIPSVTHRTLRDLDRTPPVR